jgi:hypothetical protein
MIDDVRTKIAAELKRRLLTVFPSVMIYEGGGSVWGVWTRELPCFHIFEHVTEVKSSDTSTRGVLHTKLPIQIEYVSKLTNRNLLFTEGRTKLKSLREAIELDLRLREGRGTNTVGSDLVINFAMAANEIVEVIPNVVDVAIVYEFSFAEKSYGIAS